MVMERMRRRACMWQSWQSCVAEGGQLKSALPTMLAGQVRGCSSYSMHAQLLLFQLPRPQLVQPPQTQTLFLDVFVSHHSQNAPLPPPSHTHTHSPAAVEELRRSAEQYLALADSAAPSVSHLEAADRELLRKEAGAALEWLNEKVALQAQVGRRGLVAWCDACMVVARLLQKQQPAVAMCHEQLPSCLLHIPSLHLTCSVVIASLPPPSPPPPPPLCCAAAQV